VSEFLHDALDRREASAFVHVGDRFDADLRYCTGFDGPDRDVAFVRTPDERVLCVPSDHETAARRGFSGRVVTTSQDEPVGHRAAAVLGATNPDGTVLTPRSIPHDAALYLEKAGFDVASTDAVAEARVVKSDAECDAIQTAAAAATAGVRRAAAVLRAATVEDDRLEWDGATLTTDRLCRAVDATIAGRGADPAANTVVGMGPSCADPRGRDPEPIRPGETVLVDVAPRSPEGYHADYARTFVVAGVGGWPRRAHVAVEMACGAADAVLAAGAGEPARKVATEAVAEIRAYGFGADDDEIHRPVGHGVGLAHHERPSFDGDADLAAGSVVAVEPGVFGPAGGVRIEDTVRVREDGADRLTDLSRSLYPAAYDPPA